MQTTPLNLILLGLFEPEQELRELHVFKKAAENLDEDLARRAVLLDQLYTQGTASSKAFKEMLHKIIPESRYAFGQKLFDLLENKVRR